MAEIQLRFPAELVSAQVSRWLIAGVGHPPAALVSTA